MQDRFKFRFYDKDKKIMIKPSSEMSDTEWKNVCTTYGENEWWWCIEAGMPTIFEYFDTNEYDKKDFVIMQCTGLKDKNSKLIYEGDILNYSCLPGYSDIYTCTFNNGSFLIGGLLISNTHLKSEVIGNIYENPELLEV